MGANPKHVAVVLVAGLCGAAGGLRGEEKPLPKDLPPFGEDRPLPVPSISQSKTPEGLTVWLVPRPGLPRLTAVMAVRGGSAADPKGMEGMSETLAATLKEGTRTRTSRRIAEELQAVGAQISTSATSDAVLLSVNGLTSGALEILDVLADVARNASFPVREVELAKGNALQDLQVRASTPEFLARKALAEAVYGEHPYHAVAPTAEVIAAVTPEMLKKEHARRFRPESALLVVVGAFDAPTVSRATVRAFGGWKGSGEPPAPTPPSPRASNRRFVVVNRPGSVQSLIMAGRPAPTVTDSDYFPLLVANTVFGGSFGSRLTKNIREDKGYSYSPSASLSALQQGGLFRVRADVRNEVTSASLLEIFYEMDRMACTRATDEELARAKRFQTGLYLLRNQIQQAVANTLALNWVNGLPPEALGAFVGKVNAVTAEDVQRVGRSVLPSNTQTVVVVGDEPTVRPELALFGSAAEAKP